MNGWMDGGRENLKLAYTSRRESQQGFFVIHARIQHPNAFSAHPITVNIKSSPPSHKSSWPGAGRQSRFDRVSGFRFLCHMFYRAGRTTGRR